MKIGFIIIAMLCLIILALLWLTANRSGFVKDFKTLTLPSTPNYYLLCPQDYCQAKANAIAPIYPVSRAQFLLAWQRAMNTESRLTPVLVDLQRGRFHYIQRSKLFHFPDYISVAVMALDDQHTTLAIFSRAKYGYSDMGVNQQRVERMLAGVALALAQK